MKNVYRRTRPMSGSDIANELGISRMAVSQSLKRSLKKIYHSLKKQNRHSDPFQIAVSMSQILRVSLDCDKEMEKFFNLFPVEIKKEIRTHARKYQNPKYI